MTELPPPKGLIHALVLDGRGGARSITVDAQSLRDIQPHECLWLHWNRTAAPIAGWLEDVEGLSELACEALLEETTRPRLLTLPGEQLLLFLRSLNGEAISSPEDMLTLRIFSDKGRVISLRNRPLKAVEDVVRRLGQGIGPVNGAELIYYLAEFITDQLEDWVEQQSERMDDEEESFEMNTRYVPEQSQLSSLRRPTSTLRRFLLPQREVFNQMARLRLSWLSIEDEGYWNELNNRLIRYLEELELLRERSDLLISAVQRRLSEGVGRTMYLLAVITAFFMPISFLTSLLGSNVAGIPGADKDYAFWALCGILLVIVSVQAWLFRRMRWL